MKIGLKERLQQLLSAKPEERIATIPKLEPLPEEVKNTLESILEILGEKVELKDLKGIREEIDIQKCRIVFLNTISAYPQTVYDTRAYWERYAACLAKHGIHIRDKDDPADSYSNPLSVPPQPSE